MRATVVNVALAYNYLFILEELSLIETDPEITAFVDQALDRGGNNPPHEDPFDNFGFSDEPDGWLDTHENAGG